MAANFTNDSNAAGFQVEHKIGRVAAIDWSLDNRQWFGIRLKIDNGGNPN